MAGVGAVQTGVEMLDPPYPVALRRVVVDSPSQHLGLDFPRYVEALASVITHSTPRFAIGVFGPWGSGKTTLMDAIGKRFEHDPGVICINFSAWRYEKEAHLIVPLIDTMRDALLRWSKGQPAPAAAGGLRAAEKLGRIARALLAGVTFKAGLPHAAELSFEANKAITAYDEQRRISEAAEVPQSFYFASFRALQDVFREFGAGSDRRIVVFIDDLDRCLPKGALEILESMKLFFDIEGFVFVVGLDRRVVEWCVEASYLREFPVMPGAVSEEARIKGAEYINKIFQVPFAVPPISTRQIDDYLQAIIRESCMDIAEQTELTSVVRPHLDYLAGESGINPRRVKQYINDYVIQRSVKPSLHHAAVLALLTVNYREDWGVVRSAFYADDRELVVSALRQPDVAQQRQALEDVDPDYVTIPNDFLSYVAAPTPPQPAGPGRALLLVPNLDEYIYAGEATRPTARPELIQLLPRVSRLRRVLDDAIDADGIVHDPDRQKELIQQLSEVAQLVPSIVPGTTGALAAGNLQAVLQAVQNPPVSTLALEARRAWRSEQEAQLRAAKRTLLVARDWPTFAPQSIGGTV